MLTKMVSTLNLDEKYNRVRKNFCFYLDIQDHGLARSLSRRIQDMGLQQEVFLTSRVTHVVRSRRAPCVAGGGSPCAGPAPARREWRARADAMLERVPREPTDAPPPPPSHAAAVQLTVQKAVSLLDKLYDTFFTASRKAHVAYFTKHFIKIEFLDKPCRPIYKEFDAWPAISLEPDPPREKKKENPERNTITNQKTREAILRMTRKSRPRGKERSAGGVGGVGAGVTAVGAGGGEARGGYCEMCSSEYADAALHRRSPHHAAFVRDRANFLALDELIGAGATVQAFLDKAERRSARHCNGHAPHTPPAPAPPVPNGDHSPRRAPNGTRCAKRASETPDDRQYYKVVGVSTKLRSSGSFAAKQKESPPACNGTKPLVVKFRKVRRSELSVLSDEAEQFMFPKRASSTSSTSASDDDDDDDDDDENNEDSKELSPRRRPSPPPAPILSTERRRLARPLALKEESSEDDSWPEDKRRRKRRPPAVAKRARRTPCKPPPAVEPPQQVPEVIEQLEPAEITVPPAAEAEVSPLREEPVEQCMKWEDGKLKYTPAVEQLEFAFESVPHSEPWFETFKRQDEDKVLTRNVPKCFALYSKSPKLPYEIGQLPPLKPNCCPLSDLVKREEKPGPSRSYGTRGMKKQKIRKRTAIIQALEAHPRKSPREHASTLAILGSAGLLQRRRNADDNKSTASEDTISDTHSNIKIEPVISETREASERLQQFLSEVFEDAAEYDISEEAMDGDASVVSSTNLPDVSSLMSECDSCDLIRKEIAEVESRPRGRRGKFKKKNRTGWPNKRKQVKNSSRTNSVASETKVESAPDLSSADDDTRDTLSEEDTNMSETENEEKTIIENGILDETGEDSKDRTDDSMDETLTEDTVIEQSMNTDESDTKEATLQELKVALIEEKAKALAEERAEEERKAKILEAEESKKKAMKRALAGLGDWLQPVVRVARVDPAAARCLRSAARPRSARRR